MEVSHFIVLTGLELTKRPGWLQTPRDLPDSAPQGLRLEVCITVPQQNYFPHIYEVTVLGTLFLNHLVYFLLLLSKN